MNNIGEIECQFTLEQRVPTMARLQVNRPVYTIDSLHFAGHIRADIISPLSQPSLVDFRRS